MIGKEFECKDVTAPTRNVTIKLLGCFTQPIIRNPMNISPIQGFLLMKYYIDKLWQAMDVLSRYGCLKLLIYSFLITIKTLGSH
ncbi:unnamed protein product [Arabidopsis halleri]